MAEKAQNVMLAEKWEEDVVRVSDFFFEEPKKSHFWSENSC